jgi:tetratricopeptide (TPR) repeat protein
LVILEISKMVKIKIVIIGFTLSLLCLVSCNKKMVPNTVIGRKAKNYDTAAFDYIYVEAIKQKLIGNVGDALKYFEQCTKIFPESDAAYYQMAQMALGMGDIKSGKKFAKNALSLDQKNVWYLTMVAGVYYKEKNLDSAIIFYEKAIKYFPDKENLQLTLGNLYAENRKYDEAISIFDSFEKRYGVNESSALSSARAYVADGKYDEALSKMQTLLKEYPDEILYNGFLAEIYRAKGENEKARMVYEQIIERNPDDPKTQLSICDFLIKGKDYDELFRFINTVVLNAKVTRADKISLIASMLEEPEVVRDQGDQIMLTIMVLEANYEKDNIFLLFRPELLIKQNKLEEASMRLEEIIKLYPDNYYAWEKLLLLYLELKEYNKLFIKGEECATIFNRSFLAKMLYASGAIEMDKFSVAMEELKKAEILAGDNKDSLVQVLTMRADIYYRMKEYTKAFGVFDEALKSNKDDLTVLNNYAYYLAEQGIRLKEAEKMAIMVVEREKENSTYMDTYGWVLYKRGKLNDAARVMEAIINKDETPDAEWYEHYGFILKKQKKCLKAIESWNTAIKLDSTKSNLIKEIENCRK